MTDTVIVSKRTIAEIRAILRSFTMLCDNCHKYYCDCILSNDIARSKDMIRRIDVLRDEKEERYYVDNPLLAIRRKVVKALTQAKRPLQFGEILMKDVYRQRKYNILRDMVRHNEIRSFVKGNHTFYALMGNNKDK